MLGVKVYKVCLPSYYAWPPGKVILKVCYTAEDAQRYIDEYPNPFMKVWLTVEVDTIEYPETD